MKKIITAVIMAMIVILIAVPCCANEYNYTKYVSFGDSIAEGYDLLTYDWDYDYATTKRFQAPNGSFPKIIANTVLSNVVEPYNGNVNFLPLALTGSRVEHMLCLLDCEGVTYQPDSADGSHDSKFRPVYENRANLKVIETVSTADLITVDIGSNDLALHPMYLANIIPAVMAGEEITDEMICNCIDYMYEGYNDILTRFPKLLNRIRQLNPTATLVVIGIYNPFQNLKIYDSGMKVGYAINTLVDAVNLFYKKAAASYNAIYVDATGTSDYFPTYSLTMDDRELFAYYISRVHPNEAGAQYIAQQVLNAIPKTSVLYYNDSPAIGNYTITVNNKSIGNYFLTPVGNTWLIKNKTNGKFVVFDSITNSVKETYIAVPWNFENGAFSFTKTTIKRNKLRLTTTKTTYYLSVDSDGNLIASQNAQTTLFYR